MNGTAQGGLLGLLCSLAIGIALLFLLFDAWSKLRDLAKTARKLDERFQQIDLDAMETALYLRAMYARNEGFPSDIRPSLDALAKLRAERRR